MATVKNWNPFGVSLNVTATGSSVTRTSATKFTVKISASWETYYSGNQTNYGMSATSGGVTKTLNPFGTKSDGDSATFTGTYSISGNGSATKTITVTFKNYNNDNDKSATKSVSFNVTVPAWTSYTVKYSANGGSGAPGSQTKWKDQTLTLSTTKPTRSGYSFQGWATSSTGSVKYKSGASYTSNASVTLYAVWKANTYTVSYNPNGGSGAPANQTKTHGVALTLSSTKPTKSGFNFMGWATSSSSTTVVYKPGGTYTGNAVLNLYAVWQTAYVKPKINSVTVGRGGDGTLLHVVCNYTTFTEPPTITVSWDPATDDVNSQSKLMTASSGSCTLDKSGFDPDTQYTITITVSDSGDSTSVTRTLSGSKMPLDFVYDPVTGKYGVSLGKTATELDMVDIAWLTKIRNHLCLGNKTGYLDGKDGVFISNEGYIHLQRNTAQNYNPYIAFLRDDETAVTAQIQLDVDTNAIKIMGADDIYFGTNKVSMYRPYYTKGDTITIDMNTAGYVTNSGTDVTFMVPLAKPLSGISTISANTVKGLTLRQNTKYTHGSTASVYAVPSSYKANSINNGNAVRITAIFTNTENVTNNDSIGIYWNGSITFS